jgi:hypothetical protein
MTLVTSTHPTAETVTSRYYSAIGGMRGEVRSFNRALIYCDPFQRCASILTYAQQIASIAL